MSSSDSFVHLRVLTGYSMPDGAARPKHCRNTLPAAEKVGPAGFFAFKNLVPTHPIPGG
ncbi:hypothetical protein [Nonomuraea diastatica]|uniref:hypothetical protein n=1 Tax=Nonomuraea diastatica TaxID=1848329 RepID=UPI00140D97B1|nr:hypothetical protein [Nonomuraea diastatica]